MAIDESIFKDFPVLKSKRLTMRSIQAVDAVEIFNMRRNKRVNQFMVRPEMDAIETAEKLVEKVDEMYRSKNGIGWAGILRDGERIIGTCGYNSIDHPNHRAEIGGEMSTEFWGKHIAMEAVTEILRFGLGRMGLHTIEAKVMPGNRGAIFLLEHFGFKKEAHYRDRVHDNGKYRDLAVYTLLNGEETF